MLQLPLNVQLNDSARFDNFYAGKNAQLVNKLNQLNNSKDEFLFIWGAEGVGKTHLAHACSQLISDTGKTVAYLPLDEPFMAAEFLDNIESVDFVCLDGFDVISKHPQWEQAVFNLYNQLKLFDRQLVIFSGSSPNQLKINLGDLKSRLGAMEVYKLSGITDLNKSEYLVNYAQSRGLEISSEVANFILSRTNRELGAIQYTIKRLDQQALTHKRKITIPFVKEILEL